jgi:hypothetical protein
MNRRDDAVSTLDTNHRGDAPSHCLSEEPPSSIRSMACRRPRNRAPLRLTSLFEPETVAPSTSCKGIIIPA